jgi:restriction system protein
MPIPDFQTVMLPVLRDLANGERTGQETLDALAAEFMLEPEEIAQRLPSGKQATFSNRVAWAKSHLKGAGLIESPRRGVYRITDRGRATLAENPPKIGMSYLMRFPEYVAYRGGGRNGADAIESTTRASPRTIPLDGRTPDDLMEDGYQQHRTALDQVIPRARSSRSETRRACLS